MSETSEQTMAEICLELLLRGSTTAYNMVYASNRGQLRTEVDRLKKELEEVMASHSQCAQMMADNHVLMENLKKAGLDLRNSRDSLAVDLKIAKETIVNLTTNRDDLRQTVVNLKKAADEEAETRAEMLKAIVAEHTGFSEGIAPNVFSCKGVP
ncbi:uncharacterized protein LOC111241129 [Vigna radiata var. radiata]|uniref:Uncharacterized protein LOC111241129 n=1 Tax=Vigna radiata var. radiata TaxID=3916 RepID=A0A3Q0ET84_VIGRR|nr:uncharacterized protein LOC111241129 [Vigna radiata var. radiata]